MPRVLAVLMLTVRIIMLTAREGADIRITLLRGIVQCVAHIAQRAQIPTRETLVSMVVPVGIIAHCIASH